MSAVVQKEVAILGLGEASEPYLSALEAFPELHLAAVVDPEERPSKLTVSEDVRAFRSVEQMLHNRCVPDLAVICAPPATHVDLALPLLHSGVDLLIESPLATTPEDADCIDATAERLSRLLVTAAPFRASLAVLEAKVAIAGGRIGKLLGVEAVLSAKRDARQGWRSDPMMSGGGAWMDLGPGALDVVEALIGPIERIRMLECRQDQGSGVEDEAVVETDHGSRGSSRLLLSWNKEFTEPIARCVGASGEILIGWSQAVLRTGDREEVLSSGHDQITACRALLAGVLRRRLSPEPPPDHGALAVSWIHAAYRSLRDKAWQEA
jgi:predicted dehydrogenase